MKKIRDISQNLYDEVVDIKDDIIWKSPEVKNHKNTSNFSDITSARQKNISLGKKREIKIWKKQGKNFDALEKKNLLKKIVKKQNIILRKKEKKIDISRTFLLTKRKLKWFWFFGKVLFVVWILVSFIYLSYLDKLIVEKKVNAGYSKLIQIKDGHLSLSEIHKEINNARFDLLLADVFFTPFSLFSGDKIDSVEHVISWGRYLSRSLDDLLALYVKTDKFIAEKSLQRVYFTQLLSNIFPELQNIETSLSLSLEHYKNIEWLPNKDLYIQRDKVVGEIENILSYLSVINSLYVDFLNTLGHSEKRRYIVVFQNADEIRPNGGFMGSMWLLEMYKGKVQLFQKKDVYAIEWDLKKSQYERLPAPKWLDELTENFWLRDANYYLNLKDSSGAIKFFTDKAGIDIDGVIYINQNILLHLLEITWPIYFESIWKEITAENFSEIMSLLVEAKTFKQGTLGTPKQVLFDFMEVFSQKLIQDGAYFDYVQSIIHDVKSRDIMIWSFHEDENIFLSELWLRGDIDFSKSIDFSYPVYTSLSGNKSDRYMRRKYIQTVNTNESCDFEVNFQIQSTHDMGKNKRDAINSLIEEYGLDDTNLLEIQWAARNRQFVRVLFPKSAQIQKKEGMEIIDYGARKWVEFFLTTELQQTTYYDISYSLENPDCSNYNYTLFKQSWIPSYDIELTIDENNHEYLWRKEDFYFEVRK